MKQTILSVNTQHINQMERRWNLDKQKFVQDIWINNFF